MATKNGGEESDLFPVVPDLPGTPSHEHALALPKRSITPRGPLFPNLGEAHRNITSRLAPNNPFRKLSSESPSSADITSQELSNPTAIDSPDSPETSGLLRRYASDHVPSFSSRSMAGRSLTDRKSNAKLSKENGVSNCETANTREDDDPEIDSNQGAQPHDSTRSTLSRIVGQYATNSSDCLLSSPLDCESAYTFEPLDRTQGAATRLGFRGEEQRVAERLNTKSGHERSSLSSGWITENDIETAIASDLSGPRSSSKFGDDWPQSFGLPRCRLSATAQLSPSPRVSSSDVSNGPGIERKRGIGASTQTEDARHSTRSLFPPPLRIASNRNERKDALILESTVTSDQGSSVGSGLGDASTDSNDDPFKYDNAQYRRIRQLSKEREVSCALRRLVPSDTCASDMLGTIEKSPRMTIESKDFGLELSKGRQEKHFEGIHQDGSFFDPVAFRALHGDKTHDQGSDFKVIISKISDTGNQNLEVTDSTFGLSIERHHKKSNRSPHDYAAEGDWVTEATSEADFDGALGNDPFTQGIKATGSSIADYSDDGYMAKFPKLGSREKILQHPTDVPNSYEMHDLRDARHAAHRLTSHQFPRFNGFGQNNSRFDPNLSRFTNAQSGLSNPFHRDYKRAEASSYFVYKTQGSARSKYEFCDSTSTYAPVVENRGGCETSGNMLSASTASVDTAELLADKADPFTTISDQTSMKGGGSIHMHKRDHSPHPAMLSIPNNSCRGSTSAATREPDDPTPLTASDYGEGPTPSSSKFSFKLLDLSEAQELQRLRRSSDDTNKTGSTAKYHRSFSDSSSRPSLTPLPRPSAAYMRRKSHVRKGSRLSSTFTPPAWRTREVDGK